MPKAAEATKPKRKGRGRAFDTTETNLGTVAKASKTTISVDEAKASKTTISVDEAKASKPHRTVRLMEQQADLSRREVEAVLAYISEADGATVKGAVANLDRDDLIGLREGITSDLAALYGITEQATAQLKHIVQKNLSRSENTEVLDESYALYLQKSKHLQTRLNRARDIYRKLRPKMGAAEPSQPTLGASALGASALGGD